VYERIEGEQSLGESVHRACWGAVEPLLDLHENCLAA
jgi:hypothetical protein